MNPTRRGVLTALIAAPAMIRTLMPIKKTPFVTNHLYDFDRSWKRSNYIIKFSENSVAWTETPFVPMMANEGCDTLIFENIRFTES